MVEVVSSGPRTNDVELFIDGKLMYQEKKGEHGCLAVLDRDRVAVGIELAERIARRFDMSLYRFTDGDLRDFGMSSVGDNDVPLSG